MVISMPVILFYLIINLFSKKTKKPVGRVE